MGTSKAFILVAISLVMSGCVRPNPGCDDVDCKTVNQAMDGTGSVNGGTATYSIALDIPSSPGLAPLLHLSYSSRNGNGSMGMSWSINSYSQVYRCPALVSYDGFATGVRYQPADRLCKDGDHLVALHGEYGRSGTLYVNMFDDHDTLEQIGSLDSPHSYFIETRKNGNKAFYEMPFTPRGASAPLIWNETRLEASDGEVIAFKYIAPAPGESLVSEIRYTGHEVKGEVQKGDRVVRYEYEPRPDPTSSYLAGGESVQTQRLVRIVSGTEGPKFRGGFHQQYEYEFHYVLSPATSRSLLESIVECRYDDKDAESCDIPTRVTWQDSPPGLKDSLKYATPSPLDGEDLIWHPGDKPSIMPPFIRDFDYDADGRVELLYAKPGVRPHLYFDNLAGKITRDIDIEQYVHEHGDQWTRSHAAFVNLGAGTLYGEVDGKLAFSRWDGKKMTAPQSMGIPYSPIVLAGDFDGHDHDEVLQLEQKPQGGYEMRLYRVRDSAPTKLDFALPMDVLKLPPADDYWLQKPFDIDGNGCVDALLMKGERLVDIVLFSEDAQGVLHFRVASPQEYRISPAALGGRLHFLDINSDGLQDLAYTEDSGHGYPTWHYQINTGDGFAPPVDTGVRDPRSPGTGVSGTFVADIDNDGKDELLYPDMLLSPYCLEESDATSKAQYLCSDDVLGKQYPDLDFGIYRYSALKFMPDGSGAYAPIVMPDLNVVAQANLADAADLHGDGLRDVFSPFDPWFKNGFFRDADGKYSRCPAKYDCGLHVDTALASSRADAQDAAPDLVTEVNKGAGEWYAWHYYPLANPVRAVYTVPALDAPERYVSPDAYYFSSSMYVVGEFTGHAKGEDTSAYRIDYGGAQESTSRSNFRGFQWIVYHDLRQRIREVAWFYQDFPLTGELGSDWVEPESAGGDDYLHGLPGKVYYQYTRNTYDCTGPLMHHDSDEAQCIDSGTKTFTARKRKSVVIKQDPTTQTILSKETHVYDYDAEGNVIDRNQSDDGGQSDPDGP